MRKYFLLGAVALLAASNANAGAEFADLTATVEIEIANELNCTNINWGKLVIKNNMQSTTYIFADGSVEGDGIVSKPESSSYVGTCTLSQPIHSSAPGVSMPTEMWLHNSEGDELKVSNFGIKGTTLGEKLDEENYSITGFSYGGDLVIPNGTPAGTYRGDFTISVVY